MVIAGGHETSIARGKVTFTRKARQIYNLSGENSGNYSLITDKRLNIVKN